ncbi:hypothetical protein TNCV_1409541 [Trichonephila clavipes]|uniref:Uncharacterized protein n=1 Tax=Trichonephila clavipes TaxID=2585209 RepID=A0A8X6RBU4_TRICX|nr:hypothetical protein TNCV_1409541 [Trichonephila clavipes]
MRYRQIPPDACMIAWERVKRHLWHRGCLQMLRLSMLPNTVPYCLNLERISKPADVAYCPGGRGRVIFLHDIDRPYEAVACQTLLWQSSRTFPLQPGPLTM